MAGLDQADDGVAGGECKLRLALSARQCGRIHGECRRVGHLELFRLVGEEGPHVQGEASCHGRGVVLGRRVIPEFGDRLPVHLLEIRPDKERPQPGLDVRGVQPNPRGERLPSGR